MTTAYEKFLASKRLTVPNKGIRIEHSDISQVAFDHQRDIIRWAVRKGRAAIFADVGLGKTIMQLEIARLFVEHIRLPAQRALILAPLAVAERQTPKEAEDKLGLKVRYIRSMDEISDDCSIYTMNYEMLEHVDPSLFSVAGLDESSILKNMTGVTKQKLVAMFADTPYRFCFTATPAPNDVTELGSHAEFLGVMRQQQMTSIFFVHEAGVFAGVQESRWRLKSHAEQDFYRWLASWSVALKKPSDIGHSDDGYELPELRERVITVPADSSAFGMLPGMVPAAISATDAKRMRRTTIAARADVSRDLLNSDPDQWIVWTGLNDEADTLSEMVEGGVNVHGSMKPGEKSDALVKFIEGGTRVLITKSSIAGMGVNMQQCHRMLFFGLDFSWEQFYQSIGRIRRFGQQHDHVEVVIVISDLEMPVYEAVKRKGEEATKMTDQLIAACSIYTEDELHGVAGAEDEYKEAEASGDGWRLLLGDSGKRMAEIADDSIHISVYSPPFSDMYVYNNMPNDLSNSLNLDQFFEHYAYIIRENLRITMPGRLACVHVQDPKTFVNREGYRGLRDFTGAVIAAYIREGWIYRSCITIDKNPQIQASRNKDTDLLFVTGRRDATNLAPATPDYLLLFKKPGENPIPVTPYANGEMTEQEWIEWAHPIWYGIRETDVLNVAVAKANGDEKHMCPLQLPVIERALKLWSNPGETLFSPFAGVGSEGHEARRFGREFIGIELKESYFRQAQRYLRSAVVQSGQMSLFAPQPMAMDA